jgi:hypothetical protein
LDSLGYQNRLFRDFGFLHFADMVGHQKSPKSVFGLLHFADMVGHQKCPKSVFGLLHFSDTLGHQKCPKSLFGLLALSEVCPETLRAPSDPRCRCPGAIWGPGWGGRGADRASHPVHMSNVVQVPTSLLPRSRAPLFCLSLPLRWFPFSLARLQVTSVLCIGFPSAVPAKRP